MKVGRPLKYIVILRRLDDDTLYTASTVATFAKEQGLLYLFTDEQINEREVQNRIRLAMVRLSNRHKFPDEGDGIVTVDGQAPVSGWYGWRWRDLLSDLERVCIPLNT